MAPPRITAYEATVRMAQAGYVPLEPYPGDSRVPWRVRCATCGAKRSLRLSQVTGPTARRCKHQTQRISVKQAERVLARYSFVPYEPYPGAIRKGWRVRCVTCKQLRTVRLDELAREGRPCKHYNYPARRASRARDNRTQRGHDN